MSPRAREYLVRWLVTTVAVVVAAHVVPGIHYETTLGLLVASLLLGFLNVFLRPVLMILTLPLVLVTLGLFTLVINAGLLYLVGRVVKSFHVETFSAAFWGAVVIAVISFGMNLVLGRPATSAPRPRVQFRWQGRATRRGPRQPPSGPPGGGPVIDV